LEITSSFTATAWRGLIEFFGIWKLYEQIEQTGAHANRAVIIEGEPLGAASWKEWDDFWSALQDFVRNLNEKMTGTLFEIDAGGVLGDAESLLKSLKQNQHLETLLNGEDPTVRKACLSVALPNG
jgi:hypothetical protein